MTLQQYCEKLIWNNSRLAQEADIDRHTAAKAIFQNKCSRTTAMKIVSALSRGLEKTISVNDLEGMTLIN